MPFFCPTSFCLLAPLSRTPAPVNDVASTFARELERDRRQLLSRLPSMRIARDNHSTTSDQKIQIGAPVGLHHVINVKFVIAATER